MAPTTTQATASAAHLGLAALKTLVERRFGLELRPEDDGRHASLLAELAQTRGLSPHQLVESLSALELGFLADRLTVNETFFFRNAEHFKALSSLVLPELLKTARDEHRAVRVLSAGCASGEEAYSVAIALEDVGAQPHEIAVTAVDLSPSVIERARRARFSAWSLRATPDALRSRYFTRDGQEWVLSPRIAGRVAFELGNLADPLQTFWSGPPYDLILCRNVLMYFSAEAMNQTLARLELALRLGGYLFLGHAESLRSRTTATNAPPATFQMQVRQAHEAFFYTKVAVPPDHESTTQAPSLASAGSLGPATGPTHGPPDPAWFENIGRQGERIASLHAEALRRDAETQRKSRVTTTPPADDGPPTPRSRLLTAVSALDAGRFDEVEALCAPLIEDPDAQYLLALRREHLDDPEGAIAHYQMASALDTRFAMPRVHLGIVLARLGDDEAAHKAFSEAVLLLPSESDERLLWFGGGFSREGLREHCRRMARTGEVKLG